MCNKIKNKHIVLCQYVLTLLIVIRHGRNIEAWNLYDNRAQLAATIQKIYLHMSNIAVPVFFYFSGFLMYLNLEKSNWITKIKRRIVSLIIPYVVWNLLCGLFFIIISHINIIQKKMNQDVIRFDIQFIYNCLIKCSYNNPLWYLRNIIVLSLLSIIIIYVTKDRREGVLLILLATVILNLMYHFDNFGIIYWLPEYLLGGYIAKRNCQQNQVNIINYSFEKNNTFLKLVGAILLLVVLALVSYIDGNFIFLFLYRITAAIFIPYISSYFVIRKDIDNWKYNINMFIYCSHFTIETILTKIGMIVMGITNLTAILCFICVPIFSIIIVYYVAYILIKMPFIWNILSGSRTIKLR